MRFSVCHLNPISADRFFTDMFFEEDYNRALYLDCLGFADFTVEHLDRDANGLVQHRTIRVQPRLNMPRPVAALLGDSFTYREVGALKGRAWHSDIIPSRLPDRIAVHSVLRVEPAGPNQCRRLAHFDVRVDVFGVGTLVERFIARTLRESYDAATAHTIEWLDARTAVRTA